MDYKLVTTSDELDALCEELRSAKIIAVDTETEGIEYSDIIVGIALSHKPNYGRYIPIRHEAVDGIRFDNQLTPEEVYSKLGPILESKPCTGHNAKFDLKMFWKDGININYVHDTLIMAHVLGLDANNSRGLKQLVEKFFNHKMNDIDSLFPRVGNKKPKIQPKILSPEDIEFYGCEDGNWSFQLFAYLVRMFENNPRLQQVYNLEMRLLSVVAEMESFGVPVSMDFLVNNGNRADKYIEQLRNEILSEIRTELEDPDYEINLKSQPQLSTLLFDHLGLPKIKFSAKTQKPSTDAAVLQELAKISPVVQRILTLRALEKLNNTYLTGLQSSVDSDGRIRGNFNQVGTASGRFSSSSPNLQNLPKDQTFVLWEPDSETASRVESHFVSVDPPLLRMSENGDWQAYNEEVGTWDDGYLGPFGDREYSVYNGKLYEAWKCKTRDFISASEDHYLIEADYSQVELRIMAGESQEPTLLDAYNSGDDVHKRTASVVFDEPFEQVTKEQRHIGKTINFSLLYGAGPYNIAQQLGIEVEEAEDIVNRYFTNLSSVQSWINRVKQDTRMDGYAETVFGRRRAFPNVRGSDRKLAEKELRESVNHHIQGAAADIMKTALVRSNLFLRKYFGDKIKIISTVHDSVLIECHNSCPPDQVFRVLKASMEDISLEPAQIEAYKSGEVDALTVVTGWPKLEIDAKVGKSWGSSEDFVNAADTMPEASTDDIPTIRVRKIAQERESYEQELVTWNIEIKKPVGDSINWLFDFFESRRDDNGAHVNLTFTSEDGTIYSKALTGRYDISFEDETEVRLRLGPCIFVQDMESLDYAEVLRGIDFGLA